MVLLITRSVTGRVHLRKRNYARRVINLNAADANNALQHRHLGIPRITQSIDFLNLGLGYKNIN